MTKTDLFFNWFLIGLIFEIMKLLSDISNLFYLAHAGIVGAFMGFAAFDKSGMKGK